MGGEFFTFVINFFGNFGFNAECMVGVLDEEEKFFRGVVIIDGSDDAYSGKKWPHLFLLKYCLIVGLLGTFSFYGEQDKSAGKVPS